MNPARNHPPSPPLAVDFDGTLVQEETHRAVLGYAFTHRPHLCVYAFFLLMTQGVASAKCFLASAVLPRMNPVWTVRCDLYRWLVEEKKRGRSLLLVTGAPLCVVTWRERWLPLFDDVLTSSPGCNMVGKQKVAQLVARFGEKGFDYIGNSWKDRHVWRVCRQPYIVAPSRGLNRCVMRFMPFFNLWADGSWKKGGLQKNDVEKNASVR